MVKRRKGKFAMYKLDRRKKYNLYGMSGLAWRPNTTKFLMTQKLVGGVEVPIAGFTPSKRRKRK
jgi:hypothetical protein